MIANSCYRFDVSLSIEKCRDKKIAAALTGSSKDANNREVRREYGFDPVKGMSYREVSVTSGELLQELLDGRTVCNLFSSDNLRKDGSFGSSEKKNDNFRGSYIIGVDIDETNFGCMRDFISALSMKPSLAFTSYSNMQFDQEKLEFKGARFRLIYVFDQLIEGSYFFRYAANELNKKIEADTGEEIHDNCNLRCAQYFNGTCKDNPALYVDEYKTDLIYSLEDLNVSNEGYLDFLEDYAGYKTVTQDRTSEIESEMSKVMADMGISLNEEEPLEAKYEDPEPKREECSVSPQLVSDMKRLSYDEFMKYNRHKFSYSYRSESDEWIDGIYQKVSADYFSLYWNAQKVKDGQKRRKKLYERMCLRRVMKPEISADELLFCAYEDRYRFFEIDKDLSVECLVKNVEAAMKLEIPEIEKLYSKNLAYLRGRSGKKGIILKSNSGDISERNCIFKEIRYNIIAESYDPSKSVRENLEILQEKGIKIEKDSLYRFCKEKGIKTDKSKLDDEEVLEMIDLNVSANKNLQEIRSEGYRIDKGRFLRLFKLAKEEMAK